MKHRSYVAGVILLMIMLLSCNREANDKVVQLTKRIQYDVDIKSQDPDADWWVQNIEGEKREAFVKDLLEKAYNGRLQVHDESGNPLSPEQAWSIGNRRDTITIERTLPPYDIYDTVVEEKVEVRDITRIRFLEEWAVDGSTMQISKRVIAICPLLKRYNDDGSLRGYLPLFWVYYDNAMISENAEGN